jgi:hypothetical protein
MTTLHQLKRSDVGMENAHFQSIVKSFALEHLVQVALSGGSLCCKLALVRLLQPAVQKKRPFSGFERRDWPRLARGITQKFVP